MKQFKRIDPYPLTPPLALYSAQQLKTYKKMSLQVFQKLFCPQSWPTTLPSFKDAFKGFAMEPENLIVAPRLQTWKRERREKRKSVMQYKRRHLKDNRDIYNIIGAEQQ